MQKNCTEIKLHHDPVLLKETLEFLALKPGMTVVDATLGLGGHAEAILTATAPNGKLYAFDRDPRNIALAVPRISKLGKVTVFQDTFAALTTRLRGENINSVDAILFDLGLSSPHVDDAERGFSFLKDGPLDMRFDPTQGQTAEELIHSSTEKELADIFWRYGEERRSRRLARALVEARRTERFTRTTQLAHFIETVLGRGRPGRHPATQIFQALRMAVNEELKALELGLYQAIEFLAPHGHLVVISYHSLEDRIVKRIFKELTTDQRDPTDIYGCRVLRSRILSLLTKKPITPTPTEIQFNSRARSAKLRAVEKLPPSTS